MADVNATAATISTELIKIVMPVIETAQHVLEAIMITTVSLALPALTLVMMALADAGLVTEIALDQVPQWFAPIAVTDVLPAMLVDVLPVLLMLAYSEMFATVTTAIIGTVEHPPAEPVIILVILAQVTILQQAVPVARPTQVIMAVSEPVLATMDFT